MYKVSAINFKNTIITTLHRQYWIQIPCIPSLTLSQNSAAVLSSGLPVPLAKYLDGPLRQAVA